MGARSVGTPGWWVDEWPVLRNELAGKAAGLVDEVRFRLSELHLGFEASRLVPLGRTFDHHPQPPPATPSGPRSRQERRNRTESGMPVPSWAPVPDRARRPGAVRARADRRPSGLLRRAALLAGACVPLAFVGTALAGHLNSGRVKARYDALQASARAVEVVDSEGRPIGLRPRSDDPGALMVLPSTEVPEDFFNIFEALENPRSLLPWRSWYGVDLQSAAIGGACKITSRFHTYNCRGGSTLEMQAARGWSGGFGGKSNGDVLTQIGYMFDAFSISVLYDRDSPEFRRFVADSMTYGTAYGGHEMHGLRQASLMTFGSEPDFHGAPDDERLAKQAILAAMPLHRIAWSCDPNWRPNAKQKLERDLIRARAIKGLERAFPGQPRAAAAIRFIERMSLPMRPAPLPADLVAGRDERQACAAAANPVSRLSLLVGPEVLAAEAELEAFGRTRPDPFDSVRLTTSITAQADYRVAVGNALSRLDSSPSSGLLMRVGGNRPQADVLALTTLNGGITGLYTATQRRILDEQRRTGSIGKMIIAIAAARSGREGSDRLCWVRDRRYHLVEVDGFAGLERCVAGTGPTVSEAFGRSLNLPILALGRSLDERLLREVAREAGFTLPQGDEVAYALVTGMGEASPRHILAMEDALARAVAGKPAVAPLPYVVDAVRVNGRWLSPPRARVDLSRFVATPGARGFLRAAGGGALAEPRGTLRSAVAAHPWQDGEIAKTGTVAGERPALLTRAKLAVGASGGQVGWLALVAAPKHMVGTRHASVIGFVSSVRAKSLQLHSNNACFRTSPRQSCLLVTRAVQP